MGAFLRRFLALFRRRRLDRDLDDEIAFHLAMRQLDEASRGIDARDARLESRRRFGGVLRIKEESRQAWTLVWLESVLQDIRFACRRWRQAPGFALVAIITLACGIAVANTTFAIVNAALVRRLPFASPERLVHLGFKSPRAAYGSVSLAEYLDLQVVRSVRLAAYTTSSLTISEEGQVPERLQGTHLSGHGLELLGIEAIAGRGLRIEDDQPGAAAVSVISDALWNSRYRGDPTVVGRVVRLNGRPFTIIGVVPARHTLTTPRTDIWLPLAQVADRNLQERATRSLSLLGQLTDGSSLNDARLEFQTIASRFRQYHPDVYEEVEPVTISLRDWFVHPQVQQILLVLFGAGLLVLLIACANVANLLLAQAANRRHEIATRLALGASRWQIWRQLLIECLVLGVLSGVTAWWASYLSIRLFASAIGATNPPAWLQFELDWNVFVFLAAVAPGSSLAAALLSALQATRQNARDGLQLTSRSTTPGVHARRWSSALVAVEVALTLVLLSGAGLMVRSFWSLFRIDPGVETDGLTVLRVDLAGPKYESSGQRARLHDALAERLSNNPAMPTSVTTSLPAAGPPPQWTFQREDEPLDPDRPMLVSMAAIGDDYFRTLDRTVLAGRSFERFDGAPAREAAIVNERLVSLLFPTESPLGQRIRITRSGRTPSDSGWMTIVGIAPTINQTNPLLGRGPDPVVYVPFRSRPAADAVLLTRGMEQVRQVRTTLAALDPELAVFDVQSLDSYLAFFRWPQRVFGTVLLVLAAIALVLAVVALYAIVAYAVAQRRKEIGVRVALGAHRRQILLLMMRSSAIPFAGGLLAGAGGVTAVGQLLEAFLVDTHPRDPATLFGVVLLLCAVGLIACVIPARRAARLDPLIALRCE
jgi:predicted permease